MTTSATASQAVRARHLPCIPARPGVPTTELWAFGLLALAASLPVFRGAVAEDLVFVPGRVAEGQWWRLVTHPFAHVSWYHLLLDGTGFLLLYAGLRERRRAGRLAYVLGAWAGSQLLPLALSPDLYAVGLCGLSGMAHGLLAVSGAEGLASRNAGDRRTGAVCLGLVLLKSAWELAAGRAFLSALHFGLMGVPVVACHLGGVLGGLAAFGVWGMGLRHGAEGMEQSAGGRAPQTPTRGAGLSDGIGSPADPSRPGGVAGRGQLLLAIRPKAGRRSGPQGRIACGSRLLPLEDSRGLWESRPTRRVLPAREPQAPNPGAGRARR